MPEAPLLAIRDLSLSIGRLPILQGVDLELDAGKVFGLGGESGSGKSMTALTAMRLTPAGTRATGSVKLAGREILNLSDDVMCHLRGNEIGMIFQEPMTALNPMQTIGRQVAETIRIHTDKSRREARRIARETLDRVGLPAERFPLDRYPHELSGGQRQRVGIAIAIALKPKLLIADEPTTALDVTTQAQILDLLRRLVAEDGIGLMLITHDLAVVADMADRVAVMEAGRVVESGDTLALFTAMQHPYTRRLFEASRHVPARQTRKPAQGEVPLLKVENAVREYRRGGFFARRAAPLRAVDGVSFSIFPGENVGLVGESGCGKSTLARAVLGLETLQQGSVRLKNQLFATTERLPAPEDRRAIQVVFQDPYGSFNPRHRVERLVAEPLHLLKEKPGAAERKSRVARVLDAVGLPANAGERYIHEFSGGQRQRLAIARALIVEPQLIVLDEAVSALDVSIRAQILDLLTDLSDRLSVSYLFISHDLSVVRNITDRVMVMRDGRIVEEGPTGEVFANPRHPYTSELLAATPLVDEALGRRRKAGAATE